MFFVFLPVRQAGAEGKGDDVGIVVVIEKFFVDVAQVFIAAENERKADEMTKWWDDLLMNKFFQFSFLLQRKFYIGIVEGNGHSGLQVTG